MLLRASDALRPTLRLIPFVFVSGLLATALVATSAVAQETPMNPTAPPSSTSQQESPDDETSSEQSTESTTQSQVTSRDDQNTPERADSTDEDRPENTLDDAASAEPDDAPEDEEQQTPPDPDAPEKPDMSTTQGPDEVASIQLPLFLAGNQQGHFIEVNCRDDAQGVAHLARQHQLLVELEERARRDGQLSPLALNLGDSTFPGPLSRFLLLTEANGQNLAEVISSIPWDAHVVGNRELAIDPSELDRFLSESVETDLPLQAANFSCDEERATDLLCKAVGRKEGTPWKVVDRGEVRVGITSVLHPASRELISERRLAGLTLEDPTEVLEGLIPEMRDAGADIVIVLFHTIRGEGNLQARQLATSVEGIDVLITSESLTEAYSAPPEEPRSFAGGYMLAPRTGTFLVEANSGHRRAVIANMTLNRDEPDGWRVTDLSTRMDATEDVTPEPDTEDKLRTLTRRFCADWGRPINRQTRLDKPWSLEDFQSFVLNVMRFSSRSEIALYNKGAFRNQSRFPLTGALTLADVYSVLPFNNPMVLGEMTGEHLAATASSLGGELIAEGLEVREDGSVFVNGRPIDKSRGYTVATNRFVASGGDALVDPEHFSESGVFSPEDANEPPTIAELVIRWVGKREQVRRRDTTAELSASKDFPSLHRRALWSFVGSLDGAYNRLNVVNPTRDGEPAYEQSQLTVNSSDQISLEASATIEADTRDHGWNTDLRLQYAQASVSADEGDSNFEETKDLIRLKSLYQFSGFRLGRWFVPSPYTEAQAESEFDPPESRDWHKLLLTGIVGVRFELTKPFDFKIGFNARRDVNNPDAQTDIGLTMGYNLERVDLFGILGQPIEFQSDLEYFYNSINDDNINEIRSTSKLYYAFFGQFFFTTTFSAFAIRTDPVGAWGTNTDLTFGLSYRFDTTLQTF